jgi:outer membrane protein OmpA-like peptidoglycan-associated protein
MMADIEALRQRAGWEGAMATKAQAWLDFAQEEFIEIDNTGVAEDALARAKQLIDWIEHKQSEGKPVPETVRGTTRIQDDLRSKFAPFDHKPCATRYVARAEVEQIWAAHEQPELGLRHARQHLEIVQTLLEQAKNCVEKMPIVANVPPVQPHPVMVDAAPPVLPTVENIPPAVIALPPSPVVIAAIAALPDAIHFASDSAVLSAESDKVLQRVVEVMRAHPWLKLALGGHTDSRGNRRYNLKLSQRRVESVYQRLIQQGLPADRFLTRAHGMDKRLLKTNTAEARSRERRVELMILNPNDPSAIVKIHSEIQDADLQ